MSKKQKTKKSVDVPTEYNVKSVVAFTIIACLGIGFIVGYVANFAETTPENPAEPEPEVLPDSPYNFDFGDSEPSASCIISNEIIRDRYRTDSVILNGRHVDFVLINLTIEVPTGHKPLDRKIYALYIKNARSVTITNCTFMAPSQILATGVVTNLTIENSNFHGVESVHAKKILVYCKNCTLNSSLGFFAENSSIHAVHNQFGFDVVRDLTGDSVLNFNENFYCKSQLPGSIDNPIDRTIPTMFGDFYALPGPIAYFPIDTSPLFPISAQYPEIHCYSSYEQIVGNYSTTVNLTVFSWFDNYIVCQNSEFLPEITDGLNSSYSISLESLSAGNNSVEISVVGLNSVKTVSVNIFVDKFAPEITVVSPIDDFYGIIGPEIQFELLDHSEIVVQTAQIEFLNLSNNFVEFEFGVNYSIISAGWWDEVQPGTVVNVTIVVADCWNNIGYRSLNLTKLLPPPTIIVSNSYNGSVFGLWSPEFEFTFESNSQLQRVEIEYNYYVHQIQLIEKISIDLSGNLSTISRNITNWGFIDNNTIIDVTVILFDCYNQSNQVQFSVTKILYDPQINFELIGNGFYNRYAPELVCLISHVDFYTVLINSTAISAENFSSEYEKLTDGVYYLSVIYSWYGYQFQQGLVFVKDTTEPEIRQIDKIYRLNQTEFQIVIRINDLTDCVAIAENGTIVAESFGGILILSENYSGDWIKIVDRCGNEITVDLREAEPVYTVNIEFKRLGLTIFLASAGIIVVLVIRNSIKLRRFTKNGKK